MKLTTVFMSAALVVSSHLAIAGGAAPNSVFAMGTVECTQLNADHLHISCKLSNSSTGDQSELNGSLINYDVKNKDGKVISSGYGNVVYLDTTKLAADEEYSIVVYAVVNGVVESQTITRKVGDK
jgi:hypothetical protein